MFYMFGGRPGFGARCPARGARTLPRNARFAYARLAFKRKTQRRMRPDFVQQNGHPRARAHQLLIVSGRDLRASRGWKQIPRRDAERGRDPRQGLQRDVQLPFSNSSDVRLLQVRLCGQLSLGQLSGVSFFPDPVRNGLQQCLGTPRLQARRRPEVSCPCLIPASMRPGVGRRV